MKFSELTQTALLGTERQPLCLTTGVSKVNHLLAQLDLNRREAALLSAAAVAGLYEGAGRLAVSDLAPAPELCPPEELPYMSDRAGSLLVQLLAGEFLELLPEYLSLATRVGQLAFPEVLPVLLGAGQVRKEWREPLGSVLGKRGCWLAAQNPEWAWALGASEADENVWHTGAPAERLLFLKQLRSRTPASARELLLASWKDEAPDERARLIEVLETGLSTEDEPFLESVLADKRKEVRRAVLTLLFRIPGSALEQRMVARARPLLKFTPGDSASLLKLKKARPASIEVVLPNDCDKAMQADGIEPKPVVGFGEKIWWLVQILEMVPLSFWTTEWQVTPADIVSASLTGEWEKEMFEAWNRAAIRQKNSAWAEILFEVAIKTKRLNKFDGLFAAMTAGQGEQLLAPLLAVDDGKSNEVHGALISGCQHDWSPEFSRVVLAWMRKLAALPTGDWQLRSQFKKFAARLAVPVLKEVGNDWPAESPNWEFWSKGVDEFLALAQFRSDVHTEFSKSTHHSLP